MPRFVLLYHECPADYERPTHWDFMLDAGEGLFTLALEQLPRAWRAAYDQTRLIDRSCPQLADQNVVTAQRLGDHRRDFLEFEGELTNHRGRVTRVAEGTFVEEWKTRWGWCVALTGLVVKCSIELDRNEEDHARWTLSVRV